MRTQNGKTPSEGLAAVSDTGLEIDGDHRDHTPVDAVNPAIDTIVKMVREIRLLYGMIKFAPILLCDNSGPHTAYDAAKAVVDFENTYYLFMFYVLGNDLPNTLRTLTMLASQVQRLHEVSGCIRVKGIRI